MSFESTNWRDTIVCLICIVLIFALVVLTSKCDTQEPTPINNHENIDSILMNNDSIKIVIKYTDSIKNEEVEKVLSLDDSATVELFKELVRE